jgi:beta-lactamase class A
MRGQTSVIRQTRLQRQKKRQRKLLFNFAGFLMILVFLWNLGVSMPKYSWLEVPAQFYRPDMVSYQRDASELSLSPLSKGEEDSYLRQKLEAELAQYPQDLKPYLFYFNLQDHRYVSINGDQAVPAASVIKLPILLEYFRQVDKGNITPYTHMIYEDFHQAGGSGSLQYKKAGVPLLSKDVATLMIQSSDNTCTNMLIYQLGGSQYLNDTFWQMGMNRTRVANWLPDLGGTNMISMEDMSLVLYNLLQSDYLSLESRMAAMEILVGTHNRKLLPALLPKETIVAHKTGDIGISLGNTGLVVTPNGQKYIVAVQVERPFNNYAARDMIQRLSKVIYDDVQGRNALASSTPTRAVEIPDESHF